MAELRDPLTHSIIGAAIEVHRHLGPGLLESAYEECLTYELSSRNLAVRRQLALPISYKGQTLELGYRPDMVIEDKVVLELKCVEKLIPVHDAQLLTYLRLSGIERGLLINFLSSPLINGIKRLVRTPSATSQPR
jgi:GxxExxY protein